MKIIKDKLNRLLVEARLFKNDAINIRDELLSDIKKYLTDIYNNIIGINSLINDKKLKKNSLRFKQIENKFNFLKIEYNKLNNNNFNINPMKKIIEEIVLLTKQVNWRKPDSLKELIDSLKTNIAILWHKIRLIYDISLFIKDPDNAYKYQETWPFDRHYRQLAKELKTCFPKFLGYYLRFEVYFTGMRIDFDTNNKLVKINDTKKSVKAFIAIIEEFFSWELKKIGYDIKCWFKTKPNTIFIDFIRERIHSPKNKICENCGKKSETLEHYHSYGRDEFLCQECNIMYLHCMDP